MAGRARPSRYRDGQNVIRDGRTGRIVYLPPEASDVPGLMANLVRWVNAVIREGEWAIPIVAALAHYQFATIHPYFDGNGRTARLLTNLLLHRGGYGLNGIYSLEEHYADDLEGYYSGLSTGPCHNYYFGRAEADVTPFVSYFCRGMSATFAAVRARAEAAGSIDATKAIRDLTARQRRALGLFAKSSEVTRADVAKFLRLSPRPAYLLCARWVREGFFVVGDPSTKARTYRLAPEFEQRVVGPESP